MPTDPHAGHDTTLEYHQRLIADPHRMAAYDRALRVLVAPGDTVLDAGAGTGVLAMLAVRAGARRAIAVESMPIATLAETLVAHNGLADAIDVVRADLRTLPAEAEVDLITSDCLGRFLIDDHMIPAMEAAFHWLKPGGRVIPAKVELLVAPVALPEGTVPVIDAFAAPTLGLDLSPASALARHASWGIKLAPATLLAPPQTLATWHLPGPPPAFSATFSFALAPSGEALLRGLAGWFRAELAPGVILETAPGVETHWHQLLMPLPDITVRSGDRLDVTVSLEATEPEPRWRRMGEVLTAGERHPFDLGGATPTPGPSPRWQTAAGPSRDAEGHNDLGATAWNEDRLAEARAHFEDAVMALAPGEDFPGLWENLGLARLATGEPEAAILPFLRALDGAAGREQSARMLVDACFRAGRHLDGARFLAAYEAAFGPHPAGWRPVEAP